MLMGKSGRSPIDCCVAITPFIAVVTIAVALPLRHRIAFVVAAVDCYCHHRRRPLLLIPLLVGCYVIVRRPLLSLHAVM